MLAARRLIVTILIVVAIYIVLHFLDISPVAEAAIYVTCGAVIFLVVKAYFFRV